MMISSHSNRSRSVAPDGIGLEVEMPDGMGRPPEALGTGREGREAVKAPLGSALAMALTALAIDWTAELAARDEALTTG